MTAPPLTTSEIPRLRLRSQRLAASRCTTPAGTVSFLGAVQAQNYAGALWAVGLRLPGSTQAAIELALAERTIVRTWALRGTLHMVAAADITVMLAALAPRVIAANQRRYRELGLDESTLTRSNAVLAEAVKDGNPQTRSALRAILEHHSISTEGQRFAYMLQRAALDGLICMSAVQRNIPVFMSLEGVRSGGETVTRSAAVAELARRYFVSRGPATLEDFVWWSGLPTGEAREGLEAVASHLQQRRTGDRAYWLSPSTPAAPEDPPGVYLLPAFDEYLLGYRDRSAILADRKQEKQVFRSGMVSPAVVIGGQVAGTWKRTLRNDAVFINLKPFTRLDPDEAEATAIAAERYGRFLGRRVVLQ